jgi:cytochrome c oxidase cbb3-type subunit 2
MKMTPLPWSSARLLILATIVFVVILLPYVQTSQTVPSDIFRQRAADEAAGRELYIANGCVYCHSQSIRTIDWGLGAERIAQAGDYVADYPILLGSQRTGPDLSQAGGEHPDDWHTAHFMNPRYTRPLSIMPAFKFLGDDNMGNLTRYVQSLGMKDADRRMKRQRFWKRKPSRLTKPARMPTSSGLTTTCPRAGVMYPTPIPRPRRDWHGGTRSTRISAWAATARWETAWGRPSRGSIRRR